MDRPEPAGCSLNSDQVRERISAWQEVASYAMSRQVQADRIISIYPKDADVLRRLEELIAAEAECCSFLEFTIEERDDDTLVQLTFPEEARLLLATAFDPTLAVT